MMVAVIDEDDLKALAIREGFRCLQAREARTDDNRNPGTVHRRLGDPTLL
jgi:hypothetical protein